MSRPSWASNVGNGITCTRIRAALANTLYLRSSSAYNNHCTTSRPARIDAEHNSRKITAYASRAKPVVAEYNGCNTLVQNMRATSSLDGLLDEGRYCVI